MKDMLTKNRGNWVGVIREFKTHADKHLEEQVSPEYEWSQDIRDYDNVKKQIESKPFIFIWEVNVLLVADSLRGYAQGLKEYLENCSDISVDLVSTRMDAVHIIWKKPIDFLIFVGQLHNADGYKAAKTFELYNKYSTTILYVDYSRTFLDSDITDVLEKNGIKHTFDMNRPIKNLVKFMREHFTYDVISLARDYLPKVTNIDEAMSKRNMTIEQFKKRIWKQRQQWWRKLNGWEIVVRTLALFGAGTLIYLLVRLLS